MHHQKQQLADKAISADRATDGNHVEIAHVPDLATATSVRSRVRWKILQTTIFFQPWVTSACRVGSWATEMTSLDQPFEKTWAWSRESKKCQFSEHWYVRSSSTTMSPPSQRVNIIWGIINYEQDEDQLEPTYSDTKPAVYLIFFCIP